MSEWQHIRISSFLYYSGAESLHYQILYLILPRAARGLEPRLDLSFIGPIGARAVLRRSNRGRGKKRARQRRSSITAFTYDHLVGESFIHEPGSLLIASVNSKPRPIFSKLPIHAPKASSGTRIFLQSNDDGRLWFSPLSAVPCYVLQPDNASRSLHNPSICLFPLLS